MEKMVFKNEILNIVFGSILIIFAFVGYFTKIVEDYLPIIVGIVIIMFSLKRFLYIFKKTVSKNATLILVIEFILDLVFAGLLIYLGKHVELFLGLVIYSRGVSYLVINYVATRKVNLTQYMINILYVTFGSFLIFTSYNSVEFLSIFISVLLLVVGGVFLYFGINKVMKQKKKKSIKKLEKEKTLEIEEEVNEEDEELEEEVEIKEEEKIDYKSKTLVELKEIAKKRKITGISQFNKAELVAKLEE